MLALAAYPLGIRTRFFDPSPGACAGQVANLGSANWDDWPALSAFAHGLSAVTWEFENVPVATVRELARRAMVFPPPAALDVSQDRLAEKRFLRSLGILTAAFEEVSGRAGLDTAMSRVGLPAVLKTRRLGYDGKGQRRLESAADAEAAWAALGAVEGGLILEALVPFQRELSLLAVRSRSGQVLAYPLVENHHQDGILRASLAPAPDLPAAVKFQAEEYGQRVLEAVGYV
ncbi:MAG: ATP-grasp domain-containing protein, partial [Chloroflexota bacterium]